MRTIKKCTVHECWECRLNTEAQEEVADCKRLFKPMYSIKAVLRMYEGKKKYNPVFFRWIHPSYFRIHQDRFFGHKLILLGDDGSIHSGEATRLQEGKLLASRIKLISAEDCNKVEEYNIIGICAFIDVAHYYDRNIHDCRVVRLKKNSYKVEYLLPF